ncbi:hypothetical protein [Paraburkholderia diazotrophica]|uniref:hypothetical protein n=1 Tax=Paraburkholderia diazotrophica TaxID=667676 RepID=UPI003175C619
MTGFSPSSIQLTGVSNAFATRIKENALRADNQQRLLDESDRQPTQRNHPETTRTMLNREAAETARNELERAARDYDAQAAQTQKLAVELFELRRATSDIIKARVEPLIARILNQPEALGIAVQEFGIHKKRFEHAVAEIDQRIRDTDIESGAGIALGTAAGTATVFAAPTAAMAIATTFGTASTGVAISTLTGAAATNAALAWLGGGALAAGGGGMSAGSASLGLAGPVGWGLAGLAVVAGVSYAAYSNSKTADEAKEKRLEIQQGIAMLKQAAREIEELFRVTTEEANKLGKLVLILERNTPADYAAFSAKQRAVFQAIADSVTILGRLITRKVVTQ